MKFSQRGLIATIAVHAALLLLLVFFGLSTPLPLPAEQGILINFGDNQQGSGPSVQQVNVPPRAATQREVEDTKEQILTQDFEESVALPAKKEPVKQKAEKTKKKHPKKRWRKVLKSP
ncbi:MAG: hypothetical protein HC896_01095 [Bacteroidales bacterium]|nr:hypothetical protein [Bacteroidales bacterium]